MVAELEVARIEAELLAARDEIAALKKAAEEHARELEIANANAEALLARLPDQEPEAPGEAT